MHDENWRLTGMEWTPPKGRGKICKRCKQEKVEFFGDSGYCMDCHGVADIGAVGREIAKRLL